MKISGSGTYYGQKYAELQTSQILVSEYSYIDASTPWHFHENPYFMYVLQGDMFDINKKRKAVCPAGSFLVHNWQEPHLNIKHSSGARGFHIEFPRSWFEEKRLDVSLWEGSQVLKNPKLHHTLGQIYYEFRCNDNYSSISIELLLMQLCENIEKEQVSNRKSIPKWLDDLKDILNDNPNGISLSRLSKLLGVHPVHLSRSVPKYLSTTLGDYIRQQKIKKALVFLVNQECTLAEIAHDVGFADQSHFTRCFKRYMGTTPGNFRTRFRG